MKDLKCGLRGCKFNKGYSCSCKQIGINHGGDCTSFALDENKRKMQFEAASDFAPASFNVDTKVQCSADCIFNRDGKCISNGITVMSRQPHDASCLTYIKK